MKDRKTVLNDLRAELDDLNAKIRRLIAFLSDVPPGMSEEYCDLMLEQAQHMTSYGRALRLRIRLLSYEEQRSYQLDAADKLFGCSHGTKEEE